MAANYIHINDNVVLALYDALQFVFFICQKYGSRLKLV